MLTSWKAGKFWVGNVQSRLGEVVKLGAAKDAHAYVAGFTAWRREKDNAAAPVRAAMRLNSSNDAGEEDGSPPAGEKNGPPPKYPAATSQSLITTAKATTANHAQGKSIMNFFVQDTDNERQCY